MNAPPSPTTATDAARGAEHRPAHGGDPHALGTPADRVTSTLVALVVAIAIGWWSFGIVGPWVGAARMPGAHSWTSGWPLLFGASLAIGATVGLLRRAPLASIAGSLLGMGVAAVVAGTVPHASSNHTYGDGPFLVPLYAALIAFIALFVPAGPRAFGGAGRLAVAIALLCTANTLPLARGTSSTVALIGCAVALMAVAAPPRAEALLGARAKDGRFTRAARGILIALPCWIALATFAGDSLDRGALKLVASTVGALLCWVLATRLDGDGARRVVLTLALGAGLLVVAGLLSEYDALSAEGRERLLATRLRLFGAHPNQIGPAFASGAVLCATLLFLRREGESTGVVWARRLLFAAIAIGCVVLLWRTASRASQLGLVVGLGVATLALFAPLPERPGRWFAGAGALLVLGLLVWATPLADPARSWLEARAFEPNSAIGQRYHYWRMSGAAIADNPILGVGPAQYYVHAQYAEPSYYDSTRQSFHPHNVLFAIAEGAGIPALLLFLGLIASLMEFARRALRALPRGSRALAAAPLAASLGTLSTNLLDLGQVQPTYLPLHLWISIAVCAVLAEPRARSTGANDEGTDPKAPRTAPRPRPWAYLLAVIPVGVLPLAADGLIQSGRLLAFTRGEVEQGYERIALGRTLYPPHPDAWDWELSLLNRRGATLARLLQAHEQMTKRSPGLSETWLDYAAPLLRAGRFEEAGEALDRAIELDPLGPRTGEALMLRVWVEMVDGREDDARETLFQALVRDSTHWNRLPHETRRPLDQDAGQRLVLSVRTKMGRLVEIELDEALERLGEHVLATANEVPYKARRNLLALYQAYDGFGRPRAALPWFERFTETVGTPIPSILQLHWMVLTRLGLEDKAAAVLDLCPPQFREELEQAIQAEVFLSEPERLRYLEPQMLDRLLARVEGSDIFEESTEFTSILEMSVGFRAAQRDWDAALDDAVRVLRCYAENLPRRRAAERMLSSYFVPSGAPPMVLLEFVARTIHEYDVQVRRNDGRSEHLEGVAGHVYTHWLPTDGDVVERARELVGGTGPAGDSFVASLERRRDRDRGGQ